MFKIGNYRYVLNMQNGDHHVVYSDKKLEDLITLLTPKDTLDYQWYTFLLPEKGEAIAVCGRYVESIWFQGT